MFGDKGPKKRFLPNVFWVWSTTRFVYLFHFHLLIICMKIVFITDSIRKNSNSNKSANKFLLGYLQYFPNFTVLKWLLVLSDACSTNNIPWQIFRLHCIFGIAYFKMHVYNIIRWRGCEFWTNFVKMTNNTIKFFPSWQ